MVALVGDLVAMTHSDDFPIAGETTRLLPCSRTTVNDDARANAAYMRELAIDAPADCIAPQHTDRQPARGDGSKTVL